MALGDIRIKAGASYVGTILEDLGNIEIFAGTDFLISKLYNYDKILFSKSLAAALDANGGTGADDIYVEDYTLSDTDPMIITTSSELSALGHTVRLDVGLRINSSGAIEVTDNLQELHNLSLSPNTIIIVDSLGELNVAQFTDFAGTSGPNILNVYTTQEVDDLINGISWKNPVIVLVESQQSLVGISSPLVLDGETIQDGDRVILNGQSDPAQNGIYVYDEAGGALIRAEDANTIAELKMAAVFVKRSTHADTAWVINSLDSSSVIGVTPINWVLFSSYSQLPAGTVDGQTLRWNMSDEVWEISDSILNGDDDGNTYRIYNLNSATQIKRFDSNDIRLTSENFLDSSEYSDISINYNGDSFGNQITLSSWKNSNEGAGIGIRPDFISIAVSTDSLATIRRITIDTAQEEIEIGSTAPGEHNIIISKFNALFEGQLQVGPLLSGATVDNGMIRFESQRFEGRKIIDGTPTWTPLDNVKDGNDTVHSELLTWDDNEKRWVPFQIGTAGQVLTVSTIGSPGDLILEWSDPQPGTEFYYQDTAPIGTGTPNIMEGATWYHSSSGVYYVYVFDGNSYQWVTATGAQGNTRGVTIDGEFISGVQQTINTGELLNIPLNFEYNLFTFNLDGTAIIDGDLNIISDSCCDISPGPDPEPTLFGAFGISNDGDYTYYDSLFLAMQAAVDGDVIEAFTNYTESENTVTLKNVSIDLHGYTYTYDKNDQSAGFIIQDNKNVTIYNGVLVRHSGNPDANVIINNDTIFQSNCKLNLYNVTIRGTTGVLIKSESFGLKTTLSIIGEYNIITEDTAFINDNKLYLKGCTSSCLVFLRGDGKLELLNCNIDASEAICAGGNIIKTSYSKIHSEAAQLTSIDSVFSILDFELSIEGSLNIYSSTIRSIAGIITENNKLNIKDCTIQEYIDVDIDFDARCLIQNCLFDNAYLILNNNSQHIAEISYNNFYSSFIPVNILVSRLYTGEVLISKNTVVNQDGDYCIESDNSSFYSDGEIHIVHNVLKCVNGDIIGPNVTQAQINIMDNFGNIEIND